MEKKNNNAKKAALVTGSVVLGALGTNQAIAAPNQLFDCNPLGSGAEVRSDLISKNTDSFVNSDNFNTNIELKCGEKEEKTSEHKCGEGKCGEGKCGEESKKAEAKESKTSEHKCGEGKCGEGKCGEEGKKAEKKAEAKESKTGEHKCGEEKTGEGKCGH